VAGAVREAAVAGLFYPADREELLPLVDELLAQPGAAAPKPGLRALICPHAGYVYSGPTAGLGFSQILPGSFDTVILLAPSHTAELNAASVSDATAYRTPLGELKCSHKALALAQRPPFSLQVPCHVHRPGWWKHSPLSSRVPAEPHADTWEHAAEVLLPFLQRRLPEAELVSVVMGEVDPSAAADALEPLLDERTLLLISSDLSHFHPYEEACTTDRRTVEAITHLELRGLGGSQACGYTGIKTLIHLARRKDWVPSLIDLRNSGDTAGEHRSVVGYASIAFHTRNPAPLSVDRNAETTLSSRKDLGDEILALARTALFEAVTHGNVSCPPVGDFPAPLNEPGCCFVTLTLDGELRGCIGQLVARGPLCESIVSNTRNAALMDPRFAPVRVSELDRIELEVSVLTPPSPLAYDTPEELLKKLRPGVDGVVLRLEGASATFLPQVWDHLPDPEAFLDTLSRKAGRASGAWRHPGTRVEIYQVSSFEEKKSEE